MVRQEQESQLIEKLVGINRVAKVVKGGKNFSFSALVIVGDGKGRVGHGLGKAREVPDAVRKATTAAKRNMVHVYLKGGKTFYHDAAGRFGAGRVVVRSASSGTGIIAGGPARAVFEALGVHDVVCKSIGSTNPHNMVRAVFHALSDMASPRQVAERRGKKVKEILGSDRQSASSLEGEEGKE